MNYWVLLVFAAILACLAFAYVYLIRGHQKDGGPNRSMARALGLRVTLSIVLFLCILGAWKLGYIHPTGIPAKA